MKMWNSLVYKTINVFKSQSTLKIANQLSLIPNHHRICENLYLGNLLSAHDESFLKSVPIGAILNCTVKETFHPYFLNKPHYRLDVEDSKDPENIAAFRQKLPECIDFINSQIESGKVVYVHCYWGLMRSATVVAAYLIAKYHYTPSEAIRVVKSARPQALSSLYNYHELLEEVYQKRCLI